MEVARAHGLAIAYERAGHGPPLVLVHGAGVDGRVWQPQLSALADEFTVVAWDEPGAGRSDDLPAGFALADYAHCLAAVIEALGLGRVHLAGLSWGGTVVQEPLTRSGSVRITPAHSSRIATRSPPRSQLSLSGERSSRRSSCRYKSPPCFE